MNRLLEINIDKGCKDVSRLRIVSYDEEYYLPHFATPINKILEEDTLDIKLDFINNERLNKLIKSLTDDNFDITKNYNDWFAIGCSLANTFSENGRQIFHNFSKFHPSYKVGEANKQFDNCLKNNSSEGYGLGTIFYIASKYGY